MTFANTSIASLWSRYDSAIYYKRMHRKRNRHIVGKLRLQILYKSADRRVGGDTIWTGPAIAAPNSTLGGHLMLDAAPKIEGSSSVFQLPLIITTKLVTCFMSHFQNNLTKLITAILMWRFTHFFIAFDTVFIFLYSGLVATYATVPF